MIKNSAKISSLFIASFLLSACNTQTTKPDMVNSETVAAIQSITVPTSSHEEKRILETAYDYQLVDNTLQTIPLSLALKQLQNADVVFVGEFHGNHASHLLEMQVLAGLYKLKPQLILSMEMFNRDQQAILNRFLDDEIGEVQLIKEAPAWNNYVASYRPLVEFAKQHFIPVIAANAAADIVRCVGREGESYFDKLDQSEKTTIAKQPFAEIEGYKEKFGGFLSNMRHLSEEGKNNTFLAQVTRDNTMAESIYQAWLDNPQHKVVHINGAFHSENHLGTVAALKRLDPNLKIQVITPIRVENVAEINGFDKTEFNAKDDFIYFVKPQPEQYMSAAYKNQDRQAMFKKSAESKCK